MQWKAGRTWELVLISILAVPLIVIAFPDGPPSGVSGAPGEGTCTSCHGGTVNSGPGVVTITAPSSYASGTTYPITVRVSDPDQRRWGFELSVRTLENQQAGNLIVGSDGFTQRLPNLGSRQYIAHTLTGTRNGTTGGVDFNFQWQAPDVSAGPVTFYVAGNAANGNGSSSGDRIYTHNIIVQPQAGGPMPSISEGGVVNNASFALHPAPIPPGTLIAIFGTNLTEGGVIADDTFLGPDGKITTTLGGASVRINGIAAPMLRAFPSQLVAQMPTEITGVGTATIQATVGGQTSASVTFNTDALAPGIFAINSQGTGQGAVLISNTTTLVAPAGSIPGRTSRPANPGEFITIFCTGLGQVTPPVATGQLAPGTHTTVAPTTVTIGGITTNAAFSGLAPGFAGLYQVDFQVPPAVPPGSAVPLFIAIGGKQSNTVTVAIGGTAASDPPDGDDRYRDDY